MLHIAFEGYTALKRLRFVGGNACSFYVIEFLFVAARQAETWKDCVFEVILDIKQDNAARSLFVPRSIRPQRSRRDACGQIYCDRAFGLTGIATKMNESTEWKIRLPHPAQSSLCCLISANNNQLRR